MKQNKWKQALLELWQAALAGLLIMCVLGGDKLTSILVCNLLILSIVYFKDKLEPTEM